MILALQWPASGASWIVLAFGAGTLSMVLLYFIVSRRGESRAVTKCAVLSVWAHIMLLGMAYLIDWIPASVGAPGSGDAEVRVEWISDPDDAAEPKAADDELNAQLDSPTLDEESSTDDVVNSESWEAPTSTVESVAATSMRPDTDSSASSALTQPDFDSAELANAPEVANPVDHDVNRRLSAPATADQDAEYLLSETDVISEVDAIESHKVDADSQSQETVLPAAGVTSALLVSQVAPVSLPPRYRGRTTDHRRQLAEAGGGSMDTEAAVDASLAWLCLAQSGSDGRWDSRRWEGGRELRSLPGATQSVSADTAVTGLALLAFLGAGHTHHEGKYRDTVRRGLEFLIDSQSTQDGSLVGNASQFAAMYCHGIATLAVSEAFIMTRDPRLRLVMERALAYTIEMQHPATGGWRYHRGDAGDTSQFGWQVMSLVSGETAGVSIPHRTWQGARNWLKRVSLGPAGGLACYSLDRPVPSASMTAEAAVCRTFLKISAHPIAINESHAFIARYASRPAAAQDLYFSYYATLALFQAQDERWQAWNRKLTARLLRTQRGQGALTGSWDPNTKWGPTGGRVYTTAMACLCLETYYRYLPVYSIALQRGSELRR